MKVSKDLSVTRDDNGCVNIFSYSLGKNIIVTDIELLPLIEALQIEHAAQPSVQADKGKLPHFGNPCVHCGISQNIAGAVSGVCPCR